MAELLWLFGAGVLAGVVSVVASLASLVSYPALLAIGLSPLSANVTNTTALVFVGFGAAANSTAELAGQRTRLIRFGLLNAAGGALGAALLLLTPAAAFEAAVPWLVGGASLVLLAPARREREVGRGGVWTGAPADPAAHGSTGARREDAAQGARPGANRERGGRWLGVGVLAVAVYTGYFGAAGGVLALAVLTALLEQPLARTIALKNVISAAANGVAAVGFALFGPVAWSAVGPLALGFLVGGWFGPGLVRRLPAGPLRLFIALCGLGVAVKLGVDAYG